MSEMVKIAVIGGSGLYNLPEIQDISAYELETPFGKPSSPIIVGTLHGKRVAFIARHGKGHVLAPSVVPNCANIYALKALGVRFIFSANACGSLRHDYAPATIAIPDQLIDYNLSRRERSFFVEGLIAHVSVAEPFDSYLRGLMLESIRAVGGIAHDGGCFLIEDGARFSTRAESNMFRAWGCDLIGMTAAPEAFLAREAEIAYASIAHITDYDSWHEDEEPVTVDIVVGRLKQNVEVVKNALSYAIQHIDEDKLVSAHTALDTAITTDRNAITPAAIEKLHHIVKRVLNL